MSYKQNIAEKLVNRSVTFSETEHKMLDRISEAINYAWNNWDENIIATYYKRDKPEAPTKEFIEQWIDNEDFEADGYNVEHLQEIFN